MIEPTDGPAMFRDSRAELMSAFEHEDKEEQRLSLMFAKVGAIHALTAAVVMLTEAQPDGLHELDGWREVIPRPPLKECKGKEARRPECAERHTKDCPFAEPPPEPKHKLLPVGTRVLVTDVKRDDVTGELRFMNPIAGRISGYDQSKTKYQWQREWDAGQYYTYEAWAFADNRVEVHPDGPECPPEPEPVKQEPTGPRVYVQHIKGDQGYITGTEASENGDHWLTVRWLKPGSPEQRLNVRLVDIIAESELDRCPNGQTGEECGSGENQCEPCLAAEDAVAEVTEESMGL